MEAQSLPEPTFSHYPTWPVPLAVPVYNLGDEACSYLPGHMSRIRAFICLDVPGHYYEELLHSGFRRSGTLFYQPMCRACRQCIPIRLRPPDFMPAKSQRRVWRANEDLRVEIVAPAPEETTFDLYRRFMAGRHPGSRQGADWETFTRFLYNSPVNSLEMRYFTPDGRLVGVGICDTTPHTLSSVYFYFDPVEARRSLGTYSQLREIALAREYGFDFVYLGYWVPGSETMDYKARFRPHELMGTDGVWRRA
jgi:arginyl-tRNA--protein-N-Asp/Glu arginylyltransferase